MKPKIKHNCKVFNYTYAQFRGIETEMSTVFPNCLHTVFHLAIHVPTLEDYLHYIRMFFHFLKATIIFGWIPKKYVEEGHVRLFDIGRTDTRQIALFYTTVVVLMTRQMQNIQMPEQNTKFLWKSVRVFSQNT